MPVLEDLTSAIDAVCAADPARLADREAICALQRQLDRLEAATTRATAAFHAGGASATLRMGGPPARRSERAARRQAGDRDDDSYAREGP
jgi:hypothetical protein